MSNAQNNQKHFKNLAAFAWSFAFALLKKVKKGSLVKDSFIK